MMDRTVVVFHVDLVCTGLFVMTSQEASVSTLRPVVSDLLHSSS